MEIDPRPSAADVESDVNLAEGLADKAGQETAPITRLTSATTRPLDVFFQAGFLGLALTTLLILLALELLLSTTTAATGLAESRDDDEETDCGGGGGGE